MPAFIEAVDLRKTYRVGKIDVPALRGISFAVQKGEFVSVVGPSGSGKSTLFYLLGGLTRADSGRVVIDGDDFAQLSDAQRTQLRKRKIGFVFQKFNLLPTLDARSNIDVALDIAGANGARDAAYFGSAAPVTPNGTGRRYFATDTRASIFQAPDAMADSAAMDADGQPVQ